MTGSVGLLLLMVAPVGAAAPQPSFQQACAAAARYVTPDDKTGVEWEELDAAVAIPLCEAALEVDQEDHASRANLARALIKAERQDEALRELRIAAEGGSPQAQRSLAIQYADGDGVPKDPTLAFQWMKRAADAGYLPALDTLGVYYGEGTGTVRNYTLALTAIMRAADAGHPTALNNLGSIYENGEGVPPDLVRARSLYRRAADSGLALGSRNLGRMYQTGNGGPKDFAQAAALYRHAAEAGEASAMRDLGDLYLDGVGVTADFDQALSWYRKAIEAGDPEGHAALGLAFERDGPRQDLAEAHKQYRLGRAAGDHLSTSLLGSLYRQGRGVPADPVQAVQLFREAAEAGDTSAMRALAASYYFGRGVEKDYAQHNRWYQRAIEAGDALALVLLGASYSDGEGFTRNDREAVRLFQLAHERGEAAGTRELAKLTQSGRGGLRQDPAEAVRLYRKAAEADDDEAMRILANLLHQGKGVPRDRERARKWERRAAELGGPSSAFVFGKRLFEGSGFEGVDFAEARLWLERAQNAGLDEASELLVRAHLADLTLSGRTEMAKRLVSEAATRKEGWAVAALAHPGPLLREVVNAGEMAQWQAVLEAGLPKEALLAAADALQRGALAEQQIGRAIALTTKAAQADPFAARAHEIELLIELRLFGAALNRYELFIRSDAFASGTQGQQDTFDQRFTNQLDECLLGAIGGLETMVALAERDVAGAAYALGRYYQSDANSDQDLVEARYWFRRAAELGSTAAMVSLGYMTSSGLGGEEDKAKALGWYLRAAEAGDTTAKHNVGVMHREGYGTSRDYDEAYLWFTRAADEGHSTAKASLALAKFAGHGTTVDPAGALAALHEAIDAGFIPAIYLMAQAHFEGAGIAIDPAAGWRWMRYAASFSEHSDGAIGMARAAALGWGGEPDIALANQWLREARLRGDEVAKAALKDCGETAELACLRRLKDFVPDRLMRKPTTPALAAADGAAETARMTARFVEAVASDSSTSEVSDLFVALDRQLRLNGDGPALMSTHLRYVLYSEARLRRIWGSDDNYFGRLAASCHWAKASRAASAFGRKEAAVLFAKVAVNRLQAARERIADLDDDIRECFIEAHRDRYRELTGMFLELGRFEEAENVLAMLKDFEFQNYTGQRGDRGRSFDPMPMTRAQADVLRRYQEASAAFTAARGVAAAGGGEGAFEGTLQQLALALDDLERNPQPTLVEGTAPRPVRVQAALASFGDQRAAALQAVVQPDRVYWLVTTPTQQKVVRIAVKLPELATKVRAYRDALTSASADAKVLAGELYAMIFAPVDAELKGLGAQQVLLSLDDLLRYVPFAALHDGRNWLVERYAFSMFRDTADIAAPEPPSRAAQWQVAGLGVTKAVGGLDALPLVADELGGIVRSGAGDEGLLPGTVRLDESFDRGALAQALGSDAQAIHIASHFVLSPKSRDGSYLLLGNGDKLPLDAFRSEAGLRFAKADFLALSACDTALSSRDASGVEIDSMAEIAQDAGAPAVLASLWPVADASTPQLMIGFYRNRTGAAASKAQALRQAQLALIARGASGEGPAVATGLPAEDRRTFDHPFFWAPFVLLGDSR